MGKEHHGQNVECFSLLYYSGIVYPLRTDDDILFTADTFIGDV